jgi:hypothetical protein
MVSHLSGVYPLSFCLISLYDGSMSNLCSITSVGISGIYDVCHTKASRFSWRKVMSMSSYLASRHVLTQSFLFGLLGLTGTSLSSASLGMVIRLRVWVTRGFQTRRVRAWVQFCTRGLHPHPTRIEMGSGTGLVLHPRVTRQVPKKSLVIFFTRHPSGPAQLGAHLNA